MNPRYRFTRYNTLAGCRLKPLGHLSKAGVAEGEGFEPPAGRPAAVFKTAALSRSANPPLPILQSQPDSVNYNRARFMERLPIAILGAGTVGSALIQLLRDRRPRLQALGVDPMITGILVRDAGKSRPGVPQALLTEIPEEALGGAELVIELMGGTGLARELVLRSLEDSHPVITANKALLAECWDELSPYACEGMLYYEAAVMAGTPVVGTLCGNLRSNQTLELHGLFNATSNFILNRMEGGATYANALAEAQNLGFAEADPTLDVSGIDAAHKLTVLARLVADPNFPFATVRAATRGITGLEPTDFARAKRRGLTIRQLASLTPQNGAWQTQVRNVLLPRDHPLVKIGPSEAALLYRGDAVGEVFIRGGGAGGTVTASAVLGDLFNYIAGYPGHIPLPIKEPAPEHSPEQWKEI